MREERKCSCLISRIIILNSIKVVTGRKEEVGNGYWVGKPAVSGTTLNITVERVLECGCPWRWRTLGERGFMMLIRNYGNMQTFWRMISRVKHPFPGHPRVAVSLAPTHSHLSPAFSALPTSPPLSLSRDSNALFRHFPSILLPTNSRVLWGAPMEAVASWWPHQP